MATDPFARPSADAVDVNTPRPPVPRSVRIACRLVIASLALGLVGLLPAIRLPRPEEAVAPLTFTVGSIVVFGGLTIWLAIEVLRGKPWARWAMLVYLMLGWWLSAGDLGDDFLRSPVLGAIDAVCIVMEAFACYLLFFGDGARWFGALAARRRGGTGAG
jgi:hypothetical protein